jgi:hypothetical protein
LSPRRLHERHSCCGLLFDALKRVDRAGQRAAHVVSIALAVVAPADVRFEVA